MAYEIGAVPVLVHQYDGELVDPIIALVGATNFEYSFGTVLACNYYVPEDSWVVVIESTGEFYAVMTNDEFLAVVDEV